MSDNPENQNQITVEPYDKSLLTCLFTEEDWKVWERLDKRYNDNKASYTETRLKYIIKTTIMNSRSPCCHARYLRLYCHENIEFAIKKSFPSNLLVCSRCFTIFKFALQNQKLPEGIIIL